MKVYALIAVVAFALSGCTGTPENFTMYPTPVTRGQVFDSRTAVVLVDISGPAAIDYLQFTHAGLPAINAKFPAQGDSIVAIPIPVGINRLTLSTITIAGRPGFYVGSTAVGYLPVRTQVIDIDKPGLYFLGTLETSKLGDGSPNPRADQLQRLQQTLGDIFSGLNPINFQWPEK
jgi:hypothetical protein